jgi:hypothetical protein
MLVRAACSYEFQDHTSAAIVGALNSYDRHVRRIESSYEQAGLVMGNPLEYMCISVRILSSYEQD